MKRHTALLGLPILALIPVGLAALPPSTPAPATITATTAAATVASSWPSVSVTLTPGDRSAQMRWAVTPNGHTVTGVYVGRVGGWESPFTPGLRGARLFTRLPNGTATRLYLQPVVDGVRAGRRVYVVTAGTPGPAPSPKPTPPAPTPTPPKPTPTKPTPTSPAPKPTPVPTPPAPKPTPPAPSPRPTPPAPSPTPAPPPATSGWTVLQNVDLTRDLGWTQTNGVRTTDQSYNRAAQTTFGPTGMTITAERASAGATIYSSDAQGRFIHMPDHFAIEADIDLGGYLGVGMFPAFWARPVSGQGELDFWEYVGNQVGGPMEMKSTLIKTGTSTYNLGSKAFSIPKSVVGSFTGTHTWRYEKTAGKVTLSVDGKLVGSLTRAQFDASAGAGSWDSQFEAGQQWYPRLTYQVGDGSKAHMAGPIPASWRSSFMHISRLTIYEQS